MLSIQRRSKNRKGQTLVEFAFVLPFLLLLMVAIIDFGILFYTQMTITNAAWEGARAGATIVDPARGDLEIIGAVQAAAFGLEKSRLEIEIDPPQDQAPRNQPYPAPRGEPLTVTVGYQVILSFPSLTVPLKVRAVTQMEYHNP